MAVKCWAEGLANGGNNHVCDGRRSLCICGDTKTCSGSEAGLRGQGQASSDEVCGWPGQTSPHLPNKQYQHQLAPEKQHLRRLKFGVDGGVTFPTLIVE